MKSLFLAAALLLTAPAQAATAVFAGGCFWCIEADFEKLEGVSKVVSGYSGGKEANPTYEQVSSGMTGHLEVVQVSYDPAQVSYDRLLDYFFRHIDPLDRNGQFCDKGPHYRSAVFFGSEAEKAQAEAALARVAQQLGQKVATDLLPATAFWLAEDYHQDYYKENPLRYRYYRNGCGRDARVKKLWKDVPPTP